MPRFFPYLKKIILIQKCLNVFKPKYLIFSFVSIRGQYHEIFNLYFLAQKTLPGPHMNRLNQFRELFSFRKVIEYKV